MDATLLTHQAVQQAACFAGQRAGSRAQADAASAAVKNTTATAVASAESQRREDVQRVKKRLQLRVSIKAGAAPAPGQGKEALKAVLQERLQYSEQMLEGTMQQITGNVLVLPHRRGAGYTLLECDFQQRGG
jgi:hypothetical protein